MDCSTVNGALPPSLAIPLSGRWKRWSHRMTGILATGVNGIRIGPAVGMAIGYNGLVPTALMTPYRVSAADALILSRGIGFGTAQPVGRIASGQQNEFHAGRLPNVPVTRLNPNR